MSVVSSMATAISGLEANGQALAVISDNIVNANTTGFKASRGEFHSILAQDMITTGAELGRGVMLGGVTGLFNQGAITKTDRGTDVAVNGTGFFVLKGDSKGMTYTRDGSFRFDKDGWLTTLGGQRVQSYLASSEGKLTGKMGDLRIPFNSIPAQATNKIEVHLNLDARAPVSEPMNIEKPDETSQFTVSSQIFDSVGNSHAVGIYFNKTSDSTWEWNALTDGANLAGGTPGQPSQIASGSLLFDSEGKLFSEEQNMVNTSFANGAIPDQNMRFEFGNALATEGDGRSGTTQFGTKSAMFRNVQDGWSAGYLADTTIDNDGNVTGVYTNGRHKLLGQMAMARFESTERLGKVGENQFRETVASGQASIGKPNTNGRGSIMTKSLENSNVDLAKEFVEMIRAQRGFQASAKSITTANDMLDEVINLKRT